MSDIIYKHPVFTHHFDINSICRPLEILNISYFAHVKIDEKGNFSCICNNPNFLKYYIEKKYYDADIHMADQNILGNYIIWKDIDRQGKTKQMEFDAAKFGVYNTFTIIEKSEKISEYYHFSNGSDDPSINLVYLSNLDLLKRFIRYYNETLSQEKLFLDAHNIKFKLDHINGNYCFNNHLLLSMTEAKKAAFTKLLKINQDKMVNDKLIAIIRDQFKNISNRESQVALLMLKGKSSKVIAENLQLSYRTVEHYIDNLKAKMEVESRMDLTGILIDNLSSALILS